MKKKVTRILNSKCTMEKVLFVVRSLKEKWVINLESLLLHGNEDVREQILKREEKRKKSKNKAHMARRGNPISVRQQMVWGKIALLLLSFVFFTGLCLVLGFQLLEKLQSMLLGRAIRCLLTKLFVPLFICGILSSVVTFMLDPAGWEDASSSQAPQSATEETDPYIPGRGKLMQFLHHLGLFKEAFCDAGRSFDLPTPPHAEAPEAQVQGPQVPPAPVIPQLEQPLLSDEERGDVLYARYGILNLGGDDGLRRMSSIITDQIAIERSIEAALVDDGFNPLSIHHRYGELRHLIHSPRGSLLSERTYRTYLSQIRELGTRESVPYRRVIQAVRSSHLLLERADGRFP